MGIFGPVGGGRHTDPSRPALVAALDIGSSKVTCLIARADPGEAVEVVGAGAAASRGVKSGAVVDMEETERAIRSAVEQAERMAGAAVNRVSVSFAGGHLASHHLNGETLLSEKEVDDRDLRRALDSALAGFDDDGRVILHAIPISWSIDDHRGVRDPRGMFGMRLGVELHVISAGAGPVRNLSLCVERARLDVRSIVAAPYASGLAALVDDEIELGVTCIDLGAGVTSASVFLEGALMHVDVAPLGGSLVSHDLARGLSAPLAAAERIKRAYGGVAERAGDDAQMIEIPQLGDEEAATEASRASLVKIIRPRVEETLEIVRDRLKAAGVLQAAGKRVVLTGGGSQLDGIGEFAARVLDRNVRIARPRHVVAPDGRAFGAGSSTAVGLLRHALQGPREAVSGPPKIPVRRTPSSPERAVSAGVGGLARAASWFRENF